MYVISHAHIRQSKKKTTTNERKFERRKKKKISKYAKQNISKSSHDEFQLEKLMRYGF